jgi:hypothetical protein
MERIGSIKDDHPLFCSNDDDTINGNLSENFVLRKLERTHYPIGTLLLSLSCNARVVSYCVWI